MDYEDFVNRVGTKKTKSPTIEVEVMLYAMEHHHLHIKLTENEKIRRIGRYGIHVTRGDYPYATLRLTERRAINLGLI